MAQTYRPGEQALIFVSTVDDSEQPYALYLPRNYDPGKKYPLVVTLHGSDTNQYWSLRRVFGKGNVPREADVRVGRYSPVLQDVDFFVASPLARGSMGYQGIAEKDVYDMLTDVKKRFSIDDDRVYLTGFSIGGGGALWLGLTRPDIWAALAALSPTAPPGTDQLAPNSANLPIHLFQGAIDPVVPAQSTRQWDALFRQSGSPVEYAEYPRVRHNSWEFAYKDGAIFDWFARFHRNRFPERLRFATDQYKYNSAYWVRIDGLAPGTLASLDGRFAGPNQLVIQTKNLRGFTLRLAGHPMYEPGKPLSIGIDGQPMRAGRSFSFEKNDRGWQPGVYVIPPGHKRPGAEGPISEAVSGRQIYVYGTAESSGIEELKSRRDDALRAASWSAPNDPLLLKFKVLSDKEVSERDLQNASLILFGTKETNEMLARVSSRLPISLNPSAADYGLLFVYPVGPRCVLINSGLPYWTHADELPLSGQTFVPLPYRLLLGMGDYVLFKGSLENIVAAGRFTDDWRIPATDAGRMKATGAVEIK